MFAKTAIILAEAVKIESVYAFAVIFDFGVFILFYVAIEFI